ncbi:MAG: hypothetical protein ACI30S_05500 [Muribaculaceae bacterium]
MIPTEPHPGCAIDDTIKRDSPSRGVLDRCCDQALSLRSSPGLSHDRQHLRRCLLSQSMRGEADVTRHVPTIRWWRSMG